MNVHDRITLTDDQGVEVELEVMDLITAGQKRYAVFMSTDITDDTVVILQMEGDGDAPAFLSIEDEVEIEAVFDLFKQRNRDTITFD